MQIIVLICRNKYIVFFFTRKIKLTTLSLKAIIYTWFFKAQLGCALYHKHSLVWTQVTQKSECASQGSVYLLTGYRF